MVSLGIILLGKMAFVGSRIYTNKDRAVLSCIQYIILLPLCQ